MSEHDNEINKLRSLLKEKDKNLELSATYGKSLLNKNAFLENQIKDLNKEYSIKIEKSDQDVHSLMQKLETKENGISNLKDELEIFDNNNKKEINIISSKYDDKIYSLNCKVKSLESRLESQENDIALKKDKIEDLLQQLKEQQKETFETSLLNLSDGTSDQAFLEKDNEVKALKLEKQTLEIQLAQFEKNSNYFQMKLKVNIKSLKDCEEQLSDKENRLVSLLNENERLKRALEDSEGAMEELSKVDVDRKGNSVFAELDDHRVVLEKKLLKAAETIKRCKVELDYKSSQIDTFRRNIAMLLNANSEKSESAEIEREIIQMISSLKIRRDAADKQIETLLAQLHAITTKHSQCEITKSLNSGEEEYIHYLYKKEADKVSALDKETFALTMDNECLRDQLLQQKRNVKQYLDEANHSKAKFARLKVSYDELKKENLHDESTDDLCQSKKIAKEPPKYTYEFLPPVKAPSSSPSKEDSFKEIFPPQAIISDNSDTQLESKSIAGLNGVVKDTAPAIEAVPAPPRVKERPSQSAKAVSFDHQVKDNDKHERPTRARRGRVMEAPVIVDFGGDDNNEECKVQ